MSQFKWERSAILSLLLVCFLALTGILQMQAKPESTILASSGNPTYMLKSEILIDLPNLVYAVSDPIRNRIYITNWYLNIVVIDATDGTVETTITDVFRPELLALSPDGSRLYVSSNVMDDEDGQITVIDTDTFQILHTHMYPDMGYFYSAGMRSIAGGPDNRIYLAPNGTYDTHIVEVMDGNSGDIVATIPFTHTEYSFVSQLTVSGTSLYISAALQPHTSNKLFKYDVSSEQPILEEELFIGQDGVNKIVAAPDGAYLVALGSGKLNIYQTVPFSPTGSIEIPGSIFKDLGVTDDSQSVIGLHNVLPSFGAGNVDAYDLATATMNRTFTDSPQGSAAIFIVPLQDNMMAIIYQDRVRIFIPAEYSTYLPLTVNSYCFAPIIDDFSNPSSGWPVADNGSTILRYLNGEYNIFHRDSNQWTAVTRGEVWNNSRMVQVEGRVAANTGLWGIVFGLNNDWSDFYTFEIVPQEQTFYLFHYTSAGGWEQIHRDYSSAIQTGNATNKLTIEQTITHMSFYINDQGTGRAIYAQPGRIGLSGGSFIWNTDLRYDNYVLVNENCPLPGQMFASLPPEFAPPIPSPYQEAISPNP